MRICVFCGSNSGNNEAYTQAARDTGRTLAQLNIDLVYGGGRIGLMGTVADSALQAGGKVIGVMPRALVEREIQHRGLTELHTVESMHERKTIMADLADGFIALPGGAGTLEEFFEVWTWAQLNMHQKPCGLLNVAGYYDALVKFVDHAVDEAFIRPQHRDMLVVEEDPAVLLDRYAIYEPPNVSKWFDPIKAA